jgi:hypothetical protein
VGVGRHFPHDALGREIDMRMGPRNRWMSAGVAGVALGAAFVAPLATSGTQKANAVTIAGA